MPRPPRRLVTTLTAGAAAAVFASCGEKAEPAAAPPKGPSPAAEPAKSGPLTRPPEGRVVKVGNRPEGLAYDRETGLLAVGLTEPALLALVDGASGRVQKRVKLDGAPRHLALAGPGGPVLVPTEPAKTLVQVTLPEGRVRSSTPVGLQPHDATAARGRIFSANERSSTVSVIEGRRIVETLPVPRQPGGAAVAGGRLAVVGVSGNALELFDIDSLRSLGRVPTGAGPTHVVSDGRDRFFVADTRGGAVLEIETKPRLRVARRISLPGTAPYALAFDRRRGVLYVGLTGPNEVVEISGGRVGRRIAAVRQPNSVAVDEERGRLFVASRKDGTLQLLDLPPRG